MTATPTAQPLQRLEPHHRIKINPDTYIRFDGTNFLQLTNVYSDGQALRIQADIMLILWDITDWRTIESILANWPDPADYPKILQHLNTLYQMKVIITEESEGHESLDNRIAESVGAHLHFNPENHLLMLRDNVRVAAYRRAIERTVTPDDVVLDLGCGSGILGFLAAKAGAKHVYGIEKNQDVADLARRIAAHNGLTNVTILHGTSGTIDASAFSEKPTVLVSEILGNAILEEHVLEFTLDVRDRLLAPGAKLIPGSLAIEVAAIHGDLPTFKPQQVNELKDLYGIDFEPLGELLAIKPNIRTSRFRPEMERVLSLPVTITTLDLTTLTNPIFTQPFELAINADGNFSGYVAYFSAGLDDTTVLTNSPWAPDTHWTQLVYTLPQGIPVKAGDVIKMDAVYDGRLRIRLVDVQRNS